MWCNKNERLTISWAENSRFRRSHYTIRQIINSFQEHSKTLSAPPPCFWVVVFFDGVIMHHFLETQFGCSPASCYVSMPSRRICKCSAKKKKKKVIKAPRLYRSAGISLSATRGKKQNGASHSNLNQDTFIDSSLNTSLKNDYNSAQLILFSFFFWRTQSKLDYAVSCKVYLHHIQISTALHAWVLSQLSPRSCHLAVELASEAYGLWLISPI